MSQEKLLTQEDQAIELTHSHNQRHHVSTISPSTTLDEEIGEVYWPSQSNRELLSDRGQGQEEKKHYFSPTPRTSTTVSFSTSTSSTKSILAPATTGAQSHGNNTHNHSSHSQHHSHHHVLFQAPLISLRRRNNEGITMVSLRKRSTGGIGVQVENVTGNYSVVSSTTNSSRTSQYDPILHSHRNSYASLQDLEFHENQHLQENENGHSNRSNHSTGSNGVGIHGNTSSGWSVPDGLSPPSSTHTTIHDTAENQNSRPNKDNHKSHGYGEGHHTTRQHEDLARIDHIVGQMVTMANAGLSSRVLGDRQQIVQIVQQGASTNLSASLVSPTNVPLPQDRKNTVYRLIPRTDANSSNANKYRVSIEKFLQPYNKAAKYGEEKFENMATKFLHWAYQTSFTFLIVVAILSFVAWTAFFALLIVWNASRQPDCFVPPLDLTKYHFKDIYRDAWQLSWCTFATVGYGIISPLIAGSPGTNVKDEIVILSVDEYCLTISFLSSLEAFFGILYAGFWTSVLFAKVARVSGKAPVIFSQGLVVRYHKDVLLKRSQDHYTVHENHTHTRSAESSALSSPSFSDDENNKPLPLIVKTYPCPVLEFRVINRQHSHMGGEIINASVNVVASLSREQLKEHKQRKKTKSIVANWLSPRDKKIHSQRKTVSSHSQHSHESSHDHHHHHHNNSPDQHKPGHWPKLLKSVSAMSRNHSTTSLVGLSERNAVDFHAKADPLQESPPHCIHPTISSENLMLQTASPLIEESSNLTGAVFVFTKLAVEPDQHPFLKTVWTIRHVLDAQSPLLKPDVRKLIRSNDGRWPEHLLASDARAQNCIHFDRILVSFSGTSNINASSVFAQKIYESKDMRVGCEFVNLLYEKGSGKLGVAEQLVSDVRTQRTGAQ